MAALLKFIFITFLVIYAIRMILRLIFPMVLKSMFSNLQGQAQQQAKPRPEQPEGSISIDYIPPTAKTGKTDKLGDFVDYEEIK